MSGIFKKPAPQPVQQPAPMPDPDNPQVQEAKRKKALEDMGRAGRASTILTTPDSRGGTTGGDSYGSNRLGSGG